MPALTIRSRRRAWPLATLAIIMVWGATGAACDSDGDDRAESPTSSPVASPTAPTLTCGRQAPDGSTVELIESGFWVVGEDRGPDVTYGVVLENTSTEYLALQTLVVARLTDADGNRANDTVTSPPSDPAQVVQTIFPEQRIGIGDQVYLDREGVMEMTVEVGESTWMPVEQVRDVGLANATEIDVERFGTAEDASARVGFEVSPTVDPRQNGTATVSIGDAQTWAIFRDEDGAIVGGGYEPGTSWNGIHDSYPITGWVQVSRVPDGTVDPSTEIYVSPLYPPYSPQYPRPC